MYSRPLIRPPLAKAYAEACADLAAMNLERERELAALRNEVSQLRAELSELQDIAADVVGDYASGLMKTSQR